jgi:hypothetical protein
VLKVDCSAVRAWDRVHGMVLAAGRHLDVGWSRTFGRREAQLLSLCLGLENVCKRKCVPAVRGECTSSSAKCYAPSPNTDVCGFRPAPLVSKPYQAAAD